MSAVDRLRTWAAKAPRSRGVTVSKNGPWYVSVSVTMPIQFADTFEHVELEQAAAEAINALETVGETVPTS